MAYTGGKLNLLNGKMGISAPEKSVPVMKLIKIHEPKSKDALVQLIRYHYEKDCTCGIKSQGTVSDFGANLFMAQKEFWGEYRFTLTECIQWEYDLFVIQSMKGGYLEKKAQKLLQTNYPYLKIEEAKGYLDEELRIDLLIKKENQSIAGIQVKPNTFNKMRDEIISFNKKANSKWGKPVFYLFYDKKENFINLKDVEKEIEFL